MRENGRVGPGGEGAGPGLGRVVETRPQEAWALLALAHGSGAGMHHPFMESLAHGLALEGVASLRYEFPYMQAGRPFPDRPPVLVSRVREAVQEACRRAGGLPLFAGGKSLGGRMTSTAQAQDPLPGVRGLVFFGFPLHPARKPGTERARHLAGVERPMLFLQGDRDALAHLALLEHQVERLGPGGRLVLVEGADHGFHVLKRSGRTDGEVLDQLAAETAGWMRDVLAGAARVP